MSSNGHTDHLTSSGGHLGRSTVHVILSAVLPNLEGKGRLRMELRRSARKRTTTASSPSNGPNVLYLPPGKRRRVTKQPPPEYTPTPSPSRSSSTPSPDHEGEDEEQEDVVRASIVVEGTESDESSADAGESDDENEESADEDGQEDEDRKEDEDGEEEDEDDEDDVEIIENSNEKGFGSDLEREQVAASPASRTIGSRHPKPVDVDPRAKNTPTPSQRQGKTSAVIKATKASRAGVDAFLQSELPNGKASNANARDGHLVSNHKYASRAINTAAFQALRRVERFWDVQDIHTFLPQRLQPAIWTERASEKLAILAQLTGPVNRDWVVHNLQHCGGIHPGVLDFIYNKATETGKLRVVKHKEASQVPKPARLASALPTPTPQPQDDQPTSTGTATGTSTGSAMREASSNPQLGHCSHPSQIPSQGSLPRSQTVDQTSPANPGTIQTLQNGTGRNSLETFAHAASKATLPRASLRGGLEKPHPQSDPEIHLGTNAHQYTNGRLVYQAPPRPPNGEISNDPTRRKDKQRVLEASQVMQSHVAQNSISTPAASPEVGNTPTSHASSGSVELHGNQTGPPRMYRSYLEDTARRHYSPSLRHHESNSAKTQAALSLRPQLNTHYPPRSSGYSNKRVRQQHQSLPPSSNDVRSSRPTSTMPPPSSPRASEHRSRQSLPPASSRLQPELQTQMQAQTQTRSRVTSIPQAGTDGDETASRPLAQEPITANGGQSQDLPSTLSLPSSNAGISIAAAAPATPKRNSVIALKHSLDEIRQESARLREKQLHAVNFLKLEIETAAKNIVAEEEANKQFEVAASDVSARMKQVNTKISTKENELTALEKTVPSLEAPAQEPRIQSDDMEEGDANASRSDDVLTHTLLFRCASDHSDEHHENLVTAWAKRLDGNSNAANSVTIPPPCLYALFLRSVRQQITTIRRELTDLKESKAQIAGEIQALSMQQDKMAGILTALKKEKDDLMEELTKFGEEAGIQVQGL